MKRKENSTSAKLYRYFYDKNTMPEDSCDYYKKLSFAWIFIIPLSIMVMPCYIIELFFWIYLKIIGQTYNKWGGSLKYRITKTAEIMGVLISVWSMVLCVIHFLWSTDPKFAPLVAMGIILFIVILMFLLSMFYDFAKKTIKYLKEKFCTKIEWEK